MVEIPVLGLPNNPRKIHTPKGYDLNSILTASFLQAYPPLRFIFCILAITKNQPVLQAFS